MSAWVEANQRYLAAALMDARARLMDGSRSDAGSDQKAEADRATLASLAAAMDLPPAIESLCAVFKLSAFERDLLLLCAGVELDPGVADLCAEAHNDPGHPYVTFALALRVLDGPSWTALAPSSPLRHWRLIEVGPGHALTLSPLRIDERILHYLTGVNRLDERLRPLVEPLPPPRNLPPSHLNLVKQATAAWMQRRDDSELPALRWCGSDPLAQRALAAAVCAAVGLNLHVLSVHAVPTGPDDLWTLHRLWEREAILGHSALLLEGDAGEPAGPSHAIALGWLIDRTRSLLLLAGGERWPATRRPLITFEIEKPTSEEQRALWTGHLGSAAELLNGQLDRLVAQFDLDAPAIRSASLGTMARWAGMEDGARLVPALDSERVGADLWARCRAQARPRLEALAQRIEPVARWDELVIPTPQRQMLRDMAMHVRQQRTVCQAWGFATKGARGLGISALFAGASGTGKTMAAEVLAHELRLDLYRIDLSAVVSKYIGETEKNLRRVFDAAEGTGVILLFDEADALFGRRSEVKDSHDRHANIEVSYLLQRMEAYRGLAILTTNMREALDTAFLRRIRFVVTFPFPDLEQRADIWRRVFPEATPVADLDIAQLAQLHLTGGHIRNMALHGAFAAAEDGSPVRMEHLLRAARTEYTKLERPLTENETRGWPT